MVLLKTFLYFSRKFLVLFFYFIYIFYSILGIIMMLSLPVIIKNLLLIGKRLFSQILLFILKRNIVLKVILIISPARSVHKFLPDTQLIDAFLTRSFLTQIICFSILQLLLYFSFMNFYYLLFVMSV